MSAWRGWRKLRRVYSATTLSPSIEGRTGVADLYVSLLMSRHRDPMSYARDGGTIHKKDRLCTHLVHTDTRRG